MSAEPQPQPIPHSADDDSGTQQVLSAIRTIIAFGAGIAVAHGYLETDQAAELVGAVVVLIPLGWGMLQKKWSERKTVVRETTAVQAGVVAAKEGAARGNPAFIEHAEAQAIIKDFAPITEKA